MRFLLFFLISTSAFSSPKKILNLLFQKEAITLDRPAPPSIKKLLTAHNKRSFLHNISKDKTALFNPEILSWGSSRPYAFLFKKNVEDYFTHIFYKIFQYAKENGLSITLNSTDLFHAHLSFFENDLLLVFHAQEYPYDLSDTSLKSTIATKHKKDLLKGKKFSYKTLSFKKRNFIWSLRKNALFNVDTSLAPFQDLIFPKGWKNNFNRVYPQGPTFHQLAITGNTVQDNLLGVPLGSLNIFPELKMPLFWSP